MRGIQIVNTLCLMVLATAAIAHGLEECAKNLNPWLLPFGPENGDSDDPDHHTVFNVPFKFRAFGHAFDNGFKIKPLEGASMGAFEIYPRSGKKTQGAFMVRASRLRYTLTADSVVHDRVTESRKDLKFVAKAINEAYPCVANGTFKPKVAFVRTFQCLKFDNHQDTFQFAVTTDEERTYVILIYSHLAGHVGAQFGIRDFEQQRRFKLTLGKSDRTDDLLAQTNGVRPGVWIYDVTENYPTRPASCGKNEYECTISKHGGVDSFDGSHTYLDMTSLAEKLSVGMLDPNSTCNFQVWALKNKKFDVKGVQVRLGRSDETRYLRDFFLDKKRGLFFMKGEDFKGTFFPQLPYVWHQDGQPKVTVTQTTAGYLLTSPTCGYQVEINPRGMEPFVRITVGETYADLLNGPCGNYDGKFWDD